MINLEANKRRKSGHLIDEFSLSTEDGILSDRKIRLQNHFSPLHASEEDTGIQGSDSNWDDFSDTEEITSPVI